MNNLLKETLQQLEQLGTEKMRVQNRKKGAGENQFGVRMGDIRKIAKQIKSNHALALELWQTGNIDARLLAILLMKPKELSPDELDELVRSESFFWVADWLNAYIVKKHPNHEELRIRWMADNHPMAARAGWNLTSIRIAKSPEGIDLNAILDRIDKELPTANPMAQWTMNFALVETGINHPDFRERAIAIGKKHGVYSDYPVAKGCTSPYAPAWIEEMVKRQT